MKNMIACLGLVSGILSAAVPCWADAYSDQGEALYNKGDYKNAGRYFASSLQKNPANSHAVYMSSMCLQKLGHPDQAKNGFQTVIQVFPTSPDAALAQAALGGKEPVVHTKPPASQGTVNYAVKRTVTKSTTSTNKSSTSTVTTESK